MALFKELRNRVRQWANENIVGKTVHNESLNQDIQINKQGIKHATSRVYPNYEEKLKAIYQLEELLKEGKLNATKADKLNRNTIKAIHTLYSNAEIDEETYQIWLLIRETNQDSFFYDCGVVNKKDERGS